MNARLSVLLVAGSALMLGVPFHPAIAAAPEVKEGRKQSVQIQSVRLDTENSGDVRLVISIPGFQGVPQLQVLERPDRVVLDLPDVFRGKVVGAKELGSIAHPLIRRCRLAQNQTDPKPITRLVLEVAPGTTARLNPLEDRVMLILGGAVASSKAMVNGLPVLATASPVLSVHPVLTEKNENREKPVCPPLTPMPSIGSAFRALPVMTAAMLNPQRPAVEQPPAPTENSRKGKVLGEVNTKYRGTPMTIDLQKTDLPQLLRTLADIADLDIIHDPDLKSIEIEANFRQKPWDQILDIVCKQYGLGRTVENGILRVARLETLRKEEEQTRALEDARNLTGELTTWTRPLSFAKANDVRTLVERVKTPRGSLIVDDRTNTLFITDLPRQKTLISDFINTLDVPIQQVAIEAKIVEANIGWNQAFGVKWPTANAGGTELTANGAAVPWVSGNGKSWNGMNNRSDGGNTAMVGFTPGKDGATSIAGATGEMWLSFLSPRISLNVILQAAESEGNARIVSNPRVTTFNNKMGKILSGEKIPFPMMQTGGSVGAIAVSFADANLSLEVTPQINNDGTIMMELKVEKSEADFSRQVNGQPTIIRREVMTNVLVQDGGTAVLGGVYVKRSSTDTAGVPFFSKLPVIGGLFRNRSNKEESRELLMFITPRIIRQ